MNDNAPDHSKPSTELGALSEQFGNDWPIHACPLPDSSVMPCCGALPFEHLTDRITTNPAMVTCGGRLIFHETTPLLTKALQECATTEDK